MINSKVIDSISSRQTEIAGYNFASKLTNGDVVFLTGGLGSGKTTFTKGVAKGLGVTSLVRSSSFVIVNEYQGRQLKLNHMDLYRLEKADIASLGLDEYFYGNGVCLVEWAERLKGADTINTWQVDLQWKGENERIITIKKAQTSKRRIK